MTNAPLSFVIRKFVISRRARRGLSYLEVLIAAAIGLMGLLGAIAMLPVAIMSMNKGTMRDNMSSYGPGAMETASVIGVTNRQNWVAFNNNAPGYPRWNLPAVNLMGYPPVPPGPPTDIRLSPGPWGGIVVDPRFCGELDAAGGLPASANGTDPRFFPFVNANLVNDECRMMRVTLKRDPHDFSAAVWPLTPHNARLLFKGSDDLLFRRPDDDNAPAYQDYILGDHDNDPATPPIAQRRNYYGEMEYIITLTPTLSGVPVYRHPVTGFLYPHWRLPPHYDPSPSIPGRQPGPEPAPYTHHNEYLMSVVVLNQRQPRLDRVIGMDPTILPFPDPDELVTERVVNVVRFYSNGFNGGDVLVEARAGRPEIDLRVHQGDWVMLSGMSYSLPVDSMGNPQPQLSKLQGPLFQWYRVMSLQGEAFTPGPNGRPARYLTLEGSDWPIRTYAVPPAPAAQQYVVDPDNPNTRIPGVIPNSPNNSQFGTQMTIISGAVGVFQKTVSIPR